MKILGNVSCTDRSSVDLTNKSISKQIAQSLTTSLQENIQNNNTISKAQSDFKQKLSQKNMGLFGAMPFILGILLLFAFLRQLKMRKMRSM